MIYWLEENGYNVSYTSEAERRPERRAAEEPQGVHVQRPRRVLVGRPARERRSGAVEAGVNLAFFSGNEMFWKTRWGPSTEGTNTPYRTLTSYKETHFNAPVDPQDPPTWTGSWRDPRFSPPADGGKPENALTGQQFLVNAGTSDITVPSQYSKTALWRNTAASTLKSGQSLTLAPGSRHARLRVGRGRRQRLPPGRRVRPLLDDRQRTADVQRLRQQTHRRHDRHPPPDALPGAQRRARVRRRHGAVVVGPCQRQRLGIADAPSPATTPPDPNMEQATVNLLAEMGAQPGSLITGLVAGDQVDRHHSADLDDHLAGAGRDAPGRQRGHDLRHARPMPAAAWSPGVEVSTDSGATWHPATLTTPAEQTVKWTYTWAAHGNPTTTIKSRAVDDSANLEKPSAGITVNVSCPCSIWGSAVTPATPDSGDASSVEVGRQVHLRSVRHRHRRPLLQVRRQHRHAHRQPVERERHAARLGDVHGRNGLGLAAGQLLHAGRRSPRTPPTSSATSRPTATTRPTPTTSTRPRRPGGNALNSPPLHAVPASATTSQRALLLRPTTSTFPTSSYNGTNYWVDPVFSPAAASRAGDRRQRHRRGGLGDACPGARRRAAGSPRPTRSLPTSAPTAQTATTVTGTPPATNATITGLTPGTAYTFTVQASNPNGAGPVSAPRTR